MAHTRPVRFSNWYLKEWMRVCHVSQAEMVEKTGWSKTTVSLLCNNRQDYSPEIIRDAAIVLNVFPHELLMHPEDAMALRQLRADALRVVENTRTISSEKTGTDG